MILISDRNGQLGNRLFTFANFIGWGLQHGAQIANPGFLDYAEFFEGTFADPWCRFPVRSATAADCVTKRLLFPIIYFLARQTRKLNFSTPWLAIQNSRGNVFPLDAHTLQLISPKLTIVRGWQYCDNVSLHKHRSAIRAHFTPRPVHMRRVRDTIAKARTKCTILIGVHIRRGDYKSHLDGRYFFDYPVYRNMMEKTASLFEDREVGFLICSNEPVRTNFFDGLNYHLGPDHIVEDAYALASCDYLIGPPSTYTMWASYYGEVPLFQIISPSPSQHPKLSEFSVY